MGFHSKQKKIKHKKKEDFKTYVFKNLLFVLILLILGLFILSFYQTSKKLSPPVEIKKYETKNIITMTFVGDIMMDRGVRRQIEKNFKGDYNFLFSNSSYLKDSDITFGNLEGPVGISGTQKGSRFSFRMDPKSLIALKEAGFDIVSFANNHVGDFGQIAFLETLKHLNEQDILYTGAGNNYSEALASKIIDIRGTKIAFVSASSVGPEWMKATEKNPGIILGNDKNLLEEVKRMKANSDLVIVSMHWGTEYSPVNKAQINFGHQLVDIGADIVVGSHPHVIQKVETYKDKIIFYSLGNFIFDQYFSPFTLEGGVAFVTYDIKNKKINYEMKKSIQSKQFIPMELVPFEESKLLIHSFTP